MYFSTVTQLTYLSIGNCAQSTLNLEYLLSLTPALGHLKLVSSLPMVHSIFDVSCLEQCIRTKLLQLKKFEFVFIFDLKNSNDNIANNLNSLIDAFQTSFWLKDQHCFLTCDYLLNKSKFRLYTTPICIDDDFDKQSSRCELSTQDNICRMILPPTDDMIDRFDIKVCQEFFKQKLHLNSFTNMLF